ncbi:S-adenosyl-L-methionine-dependent methyltransferase [Mycobacterium sp. 852002-51057_SCH5723018]|nr:S-adenosyl-L-methionine-dependent methyltransferase [Mycobacterium sp. 852002-51057_SCH5723018]
MIRTGVTGRAARMGHRLTIAMRRWHATVDWAGGEPVTAELAVEIDSFEVMRGEGGVKGLSGPEKAVVKSNALKSLDAGRYPEIRFATDLIDRIDDGYRLAGTLHIRGKSRKHVIDLRIEDLGDAWRMSAESSVRQTDYGVKPYSLLMGSVQVADSVAVSFTAVHAKGD